MAGLEYDNIPFLIQEQVICLKYLIAGLEYGILNFPFITLEQASCYKYPMAGLDYTIIPFLTLEQSTSDKNTLWQG